MTKPEILTFFNTMMQTQSQEMAWDFSVLDFSAITHNEETNLFIQLFNVTWHHNHENIASRFQHSRNPLATDILFEMATRKEMDYDEDIRSLARKCTWALADIGTPKAKQYLQKLATCGDTLVEGFAQKRLNKWDNELGRKGQSIRHPDHYHRFIRLENHQESLTQKTNTGQQILANVFDVFHYDDNLQIEKLVETYVIVYQAYKPSIAEYAVAHQRLGGPDFSFNRMSWIKPNFLWMMYRCGWAEKTDQERVLALWIPKKDFEGILREAAFSSYQPGHHTSEETWKRALERKNVRLQWDPDHDPYGQKIERRAIQLGLKDKVLRDFAERQIKYVMDITDFVREQKLHLDRHALDQLLVPTERVLPIVDAALAKQIGIAR
jgi:hypothetical protein